MDVFTCTPEQWIENEDHFLKQLEDPLVWDQIPLLNANELHNLRDRTLVRFQGMIQDMYGQEYYLEKFEVHNQKTNEKFVRNGKFCDLAVTNEDECLDWDSDKNVTSERHTYVVISVPAINDWVKNAEQEKYKLSINSLPGTSKQSKRSYESMDTGDVADKSTSSVELQKKPCLQSEHQVKLAPQVLSKEYILNFPLPNENGKACHVKVYQQADELNLNQVCDFVGFLGVDPLIDAAYKESANEDNRMEMETLHPPSSLIPRIYCIKFKKLKHSNPLLSTEDNPFDLNKMNFIRKELLIVLTQLLLGDKLAAEYLIFHLISEVYSRRDYMPLGKFSLNISDIPKFQNLDYTTELYKFIEQFIPKSYYLPMTLENMNCLSFTPKKDYDCNRLTSGLLQLSNNTHLVLDETKLSAGKLDAAGIDNIKAIATTIKNQEIVYEYNYYTLKHVCDIPFLILSEGKSMIKVDIHVILKPDDNCLNTFEEIVTAAKHFLKEELLNDIRKYLTLARLVDYNISTNAEELVQTEFVNMRQRGTVTVDDLHSLLVLARLVCISQGKSKLDEECWKVACDLEKERKARVAR